ncbi:hypothetical protein PUV44_11335 [Xanthomonas arboricola pv. corylina]|nr:hypothetical protein PUV44_11335 [Xanthomonas arboricola pv. corylina]
MAFYGDFGIGLTREWAQANGINPIMYMAGENEVTRSFRLIGEHAFKLANEDAKEAALHTVRYLIAHAKPVEGRMWIDGDPIQKFSTKNLSGNTFLRRAPTFQIIFKRLNMMTWKKEKLKTI